LFYHLNLTSLVQSVLLANNTYLPDPTRFFNLFHCQPPPQSRIWGLFEFCKLVFIDSSLL